MSFTTTFMLDKSAPEFELLCAAYAAFNARDADATLATMTSDVTLPNGIDGGYAVDIKQFALTGRGNGPSSMHMMSQFPFTQRMLGRS